MIRDYCFTGGKFCNRLCLKIEVAALGHGKFVSLYFHDVSATRLFFIDTRIFYLKFNYTVVCFLRGGHNNKGNHKVPLLPIISIKHMAQEHMVQEHTAQEHMAQEHMVQEHLVQEHMVHEHMVHEHMR